MKQPNSGLDIGNPAFPLLMAGIAYWGTTTANGNAGGTTLVCADLDNHPRYIGNTVKILTGGAWGQNRTMTIHAAGGVITVDAAYTNAVPVAQQIVAGTLFVILTSLGAAGGGGAPANYNNGTQLTVIGTEHILATAIVAGRFTFHVDRSNMVAGDVLELRIYRHILAGGVTRRQYLMTYYDAPPADEMITESVVVPNDLAEADALRFTLLQTFGAVQNYAWKVLIS